MSQLTPDEKTALAERMFRSPVEFCRICLPEWFPTKMPWVHRGILALRLKKTDFLLDFGQESWLKEEAAWTTEDLKKLLTNFVEEGTNRPLFELRIENGKAIIRIAEHVQGNIAVIMPRGFSKTTVMNAANLHEILFKTEEFFLYVSESGPHAYRQLGTLKAELGDEDGVPGNGLIYSMFGRKQPPRNSVLKWTEDFIETLDKIRVGAVGRGGQIRGFSKGAKRPGIIVYDDLEDSESVLSDTQREKDSTWFFGTALPTIAKNGRSFVIGTLLHGTDAILNHLMTYPEFTVVRFGAIDQQGAALWEWKMTLPEIEAKKLAMASVGKLKSFYLEYMSQFVDDKTQMFPSSIIHYVSKGAEHFVSMSLAQDPAISGEKDADFCCFAVAGIENGGRKHIVDFYGERGMDPADQVEKFFELHFQWMRHVPPDFRRHGIEAVAFQKALVYLVQAMQFEKSKTYGIDAYFEVFPILHGKTGKIARVEGILKPLMQSRYLTFEKIFPALHTQFVDWPGGKKDGPDVVAMAVALLDPFAALNLDDEQLAITHEPVKSLELELGGNFRTAP